MWKKQIKNEWIKLKIGLFQLKKMKRNCRKSSEKRLEKMLEKRIKTTEKELQICAIMRCKRGPKWAVLTAKLFLNRIINTANSGRKLPFSLIVWKYLIQNFCAVLLNWKTIFCARYILHRNLESIFIYYYKEHIIEFYWHPWLAVI